LLKLLEKWQRFDPDTRTFRKSFFIGWHPALCYRQPVKD
jgi:hypothetical protein